MRRRGTCATIARKMEPKLNPEHPGSPKKAFGQGEPKGTQREPKGAQGHPKGKGSQRAPQREPKTNQKALEIKQKYEQREDISPELPSRAETWGIRRPSLN